MGTETGQAGRLERSCAIVAAAFTAGRCRRVRLMSGERRTFTMNAARTELYVPFPALTPGWTLRSWTCAIALQCSPSKQRLMGFTLGALTAPRTDIWNQFYERHNLAGKVVLDPFMGSGTTLGEALKLGAKAVGSDINPVSTFLVRQAFTAVPEAKLRRAFARLEATVAPEIRRYYETMDPETGQPATVRRREVQVRALDRDHPATVLGQEANVACSLGSVAPEPRRVPHDHAVHSPAADPVQHRLVRRSRSAVQRRDVVVGEVAHDLPPSRFSELPSVLALALHAGSLAGHVLADAGVENCSGGFW